MSTFLFDKIIFGPVKSRRLGISLGVNLLPLNSKLCNFNCIYCECGWTLNNKDMFTGFHSLEDIRTALIAKLDEMRKNNQQLDVITFAGNGEPTLHPHFEQIIDMTIDVRNIHFPEAKISVLSNSTMLNKESVIRALLKIDNPILKIDSAIEKTIVWINCPQGNFSLEKVVGNLQKFNGKFILQTMFLKGLHNNQYLDNTTEIEITAWLELLQKANPEKVMIYTIARETPAQNLERISFEKLDEIAARATSLGFVVQVAH